LDGNSVVGWKFVTEEISRHKRRLYGADVVMPFRPLKQIDAGALNVGYIEIGPADAGASH
jgi:hypothetical protein